MAARQLALRGLASGLAGIVFVACFRAYLDPALFLALTAAGFLCH
jgi:hypothetical protein